MQPLQDDLRDPAAKDNSITNAATARSNLDAAITMRSAETELQNTIEIRATASEIVAPKPDGSRRQSEKKTILKHFLKWFLEGKSLAPKWRKSADKSLWQPSCSHSNTIYEVQLQKTKHARKTVETPFTMRNRSDHDPSMIRPHTRPSRTRRTAEVGHRGSETAIVWKNLGFRASAISQKRISCETSFKNPTWRCHLELTLSLTNSFCD